MSSQYPINITIISYQNKRVIYHLSTMNISSQLFIHLFIYFERIVAVKSVTSGKDKTAVDDLGHHYTCRSEGTTQSVYCVFIYQRKYAIWNAAFVCVRVLCFYFDGFVTSLASPQFL